MKAAILDQTNYVVNVGIWDDNSEAPEGFTVVIVEDDAYVGPGFTYDGTSFIPPKLSE